MSEIIKGCLGFKGEKGEHGEVGTPIPYEGTFQELQNSEENRDRFYIIMDEQDEVYYKHWVYYDEKTEQWKDGGEYLANLVINLEDLTQEEWESLKSNLTNYYKRYESVYTTTQENEINIPINISQYNTLAILEVYIEGRMLNRNEYAINGTNSITLNIPLSEIGTKVHFIVYRSVCASNEDLNKLKGPKGDSGAIVFNTIAEMKADEDLVAGDTCQTLGYYSANDGGAGVYKIVDDDTLEDDGGSIHILGNGMRASLIIKDYVNVKQLGVKGDGETDNTDLLNSIANRISKLYFPAGTYLFNTLNIDDKSNFEIYGDGYNSILKCNNSNASTFFHFIRMSNGENYKIHDLKIDSNYIGSNFTFSFINVNNSIIENCYLSGATSQRTLNLQNFDNNYGHNNTIKNNYVLKDSQSCNSGALIECTGELSGDMNQFLHNTKIINNTCICKCIEYIGDSDLFDCIETDNCYNTLIDGNYCETTMHHGISLDTRNIKTICSNNHLISSATISGAKNGIEVTGLNGANLMEGIISNNIIDGFKSNGISVNAKNYSIIGNRINNSNRGMILLELCIEGNMICDNICTNITDYGIFVTGLVSGARILNNNASIKLQEGNGSLLYIETPMSSVNNLKDGLSRISYLNGIHKNDNYPGLNNTGFLFDMLSDGRLIFRNPKTEAWESITKTNI